LLVKILRQLSLGGPHVCSKRQVLLAPTHQLQDNPRTGSHVERTHMLEIPPMAQLGLEETVEFAIVGTQQSPIVIDPGHAVLSPFGNDYIRYGYSGELSGTYQGQNFVFDQPGKDTEAWTIRVGRDPWILRKVHMHDHVEHQVTGVVDRHFECHLVHSLANDPTASGDKVVIGVFFKLVKGAPRRESLYRFNEQMKASRKADEAKDCTGQTGRLDPREFLPDTGAARADWFHYMGSLTSPPYSENVSWYVIRSEIPVDPSHIDLIRTCACQQARPPYPLNRRFVLRNIVHREGESPGTVA
jgi:carbonic anhydrase